MVYNYINGEVTNEKRFICDDVIMVQGKMYGYEDIPSVPTADCGAIWYLQQGMTLLLAQKIYRHFKQPLITYIAIEQEIKKNEMAIKEIHSAIQIPDDYKQLLMYYSTSKEKESIKMNVQDILSKLEFITEKEIEYMCSKIDEFFTKPTEEGKTTEVTKPADKKYVRTWDSASKVVEYEGKTYPSMNALFKDLDVSSQSYYGHIKRSGLTHEEAIKRCIEYRDVRNKVKNYNGTRRSKASKTYTYLGTEMRLADLSRLSGIAADTLAVRLKKGWSVEDAVETPVRPKVKGE